MTTKSTSSRNEQKSFEASLERLEKIVAEMENGELSLEDMIKRFEEGRSLVKFCGKKLNEVERKIEILVKEGEEVSTEPFGSLDENEEEGAGSSGSVPDAELF